MHCGIGVMGTNVMRRGVILDAYAHINWGEVLFVMLLPRSIILDTLKHYKGTPHFDKNDNRKYAGVEMLPENPGDMQPDMLYVCGLSDALALNEKQPGLHYVCIRDCLWSEIEDTEVMLGVIVMNENRSLNWLLGLLQRRFRQIDDWVHKMQLALLEGGDYQQLLDLCEPVLGNSVFVLDASYSLLANTKNIRNTDPFITSLLKHGYHTDEMMQRFQKSRYFEMHENATGIIVNKSGAITTYESVSQWCRHGATPLVQTVMLCDQIPRSEGLVDLFSIMMKYIEIYTHAQQKKIDSIPKKYTSLIMDLLYGAALRADSVMQRAKMTNIAFAGNFDAYRIRFKDNSIILVKRVVTELEQLVPEAKIVSKDYEITILNEYPDANVQKGSAENIGRIYPILQKYDAVCGVSAAFTNLTELGSAAVGASVACEIGQNIYELGNFWEFEPGLWEKISGERDPHVFRFGQDVYIYYILHLAQKQEFDVCANTFYNNIFTKLTNYDKQNGGNLLMILYTYLISDRRPSTVSKLLNMHRNNVVYHIGRIEEMLDIDLDDYRVRLNMMLAFYFFELKASSEKNLPL